jgi:hypothetical protein
MKTLLNVAGVLALGLMGEWSWANSPEATPLPPVETIVERAVARAYKETENDQAFKDTYYFTRSKTTEYRNIRGNLTKRKDKTSVNEPSPRSPEELVQPAAASAWGGTNIVSSDTRLHKRDLLANTNLVKRFTFELRGREMIDGRSSFVVDFKPVSGKLSASDLKERFLNKAAGRIWVDEAEYVIVKAEAKLTEGVSVVGGLVGAVHKFNFSFGRGRTADGLWYTRLLTWHLEAREVIVERVIDCVETKSDVRKAR